jgi:hypothetical protein
MTQREDVLDGYFPLRLSITDLMQRMGLATAQLDLSFAPILDVPGLAYDAPVPLNIRSGRAGMIHEASLIVSLQGSVAAVRGLARWTWFDGTSAETVFDPMTRLAEPALVTINPAPPLTNDRGPAGIFRLD